MVSLYNRILVGITGSKEDDWKSKLEEISRFKIYEAALFLEKFTRPQRQKIYKALLASDIKKIPLVHIRNDMEKGELDFLAENFSPSYFTIHESSFRILGKWKGFYKQLFLEMNADNRIPKPVDVSKVGGFCVDLSHFKKSEVSKTREFYYITRRNDVSRYFACNHLNGYSYERNADMHFVEGLKDFDYLKTLPKFLFGNVIALETDNSISEQLKFKRHLEDLLKPLLR